MAMFTEPAERAKAMGVFGFVAAGGGSIGVLLGGILTDTLNWHWIFLVNVPIGVLVYFLSLRLLPAARQAGAGGRLDVAGAVTVTVALMLAVYAIVNGNRVGWTSPQTAGLLLAAAVLMAVFLGIEARVPSPLVPLGLFRLRNVSTANGVAVLWAVALFAWYVAPEESGLASGVVNTAFMMGGVLGLAVLASLAASRTDSLKAAGDSAAAALNGGYHAAFLVGAVFALVGAVLGAVLIRTGGRAPAHERQEAFGELAAAEAD